jgi:hypothetical protein
MLTERLVHSDVRDLLMAGTPFKYAHLIKFERPSRPEDVTGAISTSAQRYTYLTDASRDVIFDDLSVDHAGTVNGAQTYIANKVLQVSGMQEAIQATANSFTITLDGNGLGAAISAPGTSIALVSTGIWDITWPASVNPTAFGFREGDKVTLSGSSTGSFNILAFRANNVVRVKKIDDNPTVGTGTLTMSLASEEIKSILMNKLDTNYASFINREVYIYRAYFVDGKMVGETPEGDVTGPILIFKGIISSVNFADEDDSLKVQWTLTSHWGDFAQVKGRITSDEFHRALDENGIPQPASAIKPIYAFDLGFSHAETSINLLANYSVQVEHQDVKAKSGFLGLGIGAKVDVKKYYSTETRHSELDFQLAAKSIPVLYGVRNIKGIPIFADTLKADASTVYVVYALGEGQMGGIYDVYVDGKSSICVDQADYDVRSVQNTENTVDLICVGRADRGDVLQGTNSIGTTVSNFYTPVATSGGNYVTSSYESNPHTGVFAYIFAHLFRDYVPPDGLPTASVTGGGVTEGTSFTLKTKQSITIDYFSGTEEQAAASSLVNIAATNGFKIQNDYWSQLGTGDYWGPNHRLIDTAYVVVTYKISESEQTIPELEFVMRCKAIDCYNYDYSYSHDQKSTGENSDNFKLGQTVTLKRSDTNATLASNVQIIDKWTIYNPDGSPDVRFRWSVNPNLLLDDDGIPSITKFYMTNGTNNWTMVTHNYELGSGTIATELSTNVTSIAPGADSTGGTDIVVSSAPWLTVGGLGDEFTPHVSYYVQEKIENSRAIAGTDYTTNTRFNTYYF